MLAWLDDSGRGLRTYGIPDDHVRAAVQAAQARYEKKWEDEPGFTVGGLPRGSWPDVRHVMTRTSRLLVGGLAAWSYRSEARGAQRGERVAGKLERRRRACRDRGDDGGRCPRPVVSFSASCSPGRPCAAASEQGSPAALRVGSRTRRAACGFRDSQLSSAGRVRLLRASSASRGVP